MKFDSETVEMVMQDFLKRQNKIFMNEVYENFMSKARTLATLVVR